MASSERETAHAPLSLGRQFLGLRDPAFHAAGQADFLADLVRGIGAEPGDLPIMEDAEVVPEEEPALEDGAAEEAAEAEAETAPVAE